MLTHLMDEIASDEVIDLAYVWLCKRRYLDIGPHFLKADGTLTREIMPDLLHLSPKGYTIWAESIEKPLAKLLGE